MRIFAEACPDLQIEQQAAAQLPWFHIVTLITKLGDTALREWYAPEAVMQSWSRETLNLQIRERLHLRKGAAVTNFERRLARRHAPQNVRNFPPTSGNAMLVSVRDPSHDCLPGPMLTFTILQRSDFGRG